VALVLGIDWATEPKNRASVKLEVSPSGVQVVSVEALVTDDRVIAGCRAPDHAVVGVDIPFGWPMRFASFVASWDVMDGAQHPPPMPDEFRFRLTDRVVRNEARKEPLPVSADRIAMGTRAWTELVAKHGLAPRIDVLGGAAAPDRPAIIEVYPGAAAKVFAASMTRLEPVSAEPSYKKDRATREKLVRHVGATFGVDFGQWLDAVVSRDDHADPTDAFLAALTAAIYLASRNDESGPLSGWRVRCPRTPEEQTAARREGWIFFPVPAGAVERTGGPSSV
jgi:hypothetical protein